jgi:peptidoglycan-N-acetylglucosamine deacetylase
MFIESPPRILRRFFPKSIIWDLPNNENKIYLTFDDGPIPEVTPLVLNILDEFDVKATFFMVGENVKKHPDVFDLIVKKGHSIGNHSYNHVKGWATEDSDYYQNIEEARKLIPTTLFRPPHGRILPRQSKQILIDYQIIMWSVLSLDYNPKLSPEQVFDNVKRNTKSGSIIVFHDSLKAAKNMLPALKKSINYLKEKGFDFSTL